MQKIAYHIKTKEETRKPNAFKRFARQWDLQLMVLPALFFILVFSYIPMYGVLMAFQDYNLFKGFTGSPWVGLKHFEMFFAAPEFWTVMRNTIVISLLKLLVGFPAPILLALMLNEVRSRVFKRTVQTISYLPHFLSWVIVSGFVMSMLSTENGSVNMLLQQLNLIKDPVNFLSLPEYFWTILVTTGVWKEIGFSSIVYLAAIAGIDPHMHEAASIDGAGKLRQMFSITLPSILPVIIVFLILAIGNLLSAGFEDILLLGANPVLRDVGDVLDTYVYRIGIQNNRYSYATAAGLFKSLIGVFLLIGANYAARKSGNSLW
ncbi:MULTISPECIES: ABC transporter permease subunit [unclassified Paenibacillus]|uniref:ABC transporter permease n=1 Tax=unclassified Paenibacillus TaxID=185978 RepID=UPI0024067104|nr:MULTISPECIES: ABC transporter permease subunit [unclassified Paenibacillus]MDF9839428.1 putative aldouronate transport system permease protein [Paenibacillus sp. PastF-2]MDF9846008.1 putative aldouronate transport system permease protein [Paenibacillus sp. PastM-2]MDF9852581.1 putative aldouronate transport system permease protein [Paenibacillus sp. PastF-1]MDH6477689.1 putative aldouronate transport system permease protein [Paenibacillus sp. PastH-2]MDH6505428.1 putative aldouronate transp